MKLCCVWDCFNKYVISAFQWIQVSLEWHKAADSVRGKRNTLVNTWLQPLAATNFLLN